MKKLILLLLILASVSCNTNISLKSKDENKTKLTFPELTSILNPQDALAFFYTRDIDKSLTTNCGIATPGTTAGATPTPGGVGAVPTTGTTGTSTSKRIILSQLVFKTGETLTMKFQYDSNQFQGALDQQQGFTLTGGIFGHTVTGKQGTIKWTGQSLGYIDETNNAAQNLTFLIVDVNLRGTFTPNSSSSGSTPIECNTLDGINCTSSVSTTKCFTQDSRTCMSSGTTCKTNDGINCDSNGTSSCTTLNSIKCSTPTAITISGSINCNAANVIPQ